MLLVAAAVFVAARWDTIPDAFKLAAIGLMTGGFLLAGKALRPTLPGTAGAMYHLGAFLIPVDIAAIGVHLQMDPSELLLAQGTVCTSAFWLLGRTERSVLLRWATAAAAPVAIAGLAGVTETPFALLLSGAAAIALLLGARRTAVAWAIVAGFAPLLIAMDALSGSAGQLLTDLDLFGHEMGALAAASGAIAASVLAVEAHRRQDAGLAAVAMVSLVIGVGRSWTSLDQSGAATAVALAGAFAAIQVAALLTRRDPFWRRQSHVVGVVSEVATGLASLAAIPLLVAIAADWINYDASAALSFALVSVGWFIADLRRRSEDSLDIATALLLGSGWAPATFFAVLTTATAAGFLGGPAAAAVVLAAGAAVVVVTARPLSAPVALSAAVAAPFVAYHQPWLAVGLGLSGMATLTYAALLRARQTADAGPAETAWILAVLAPTPLLAAAAVQANLSLIAALVGGACALWASGAALDRGEVTPSMNGIGLVGRAFAVGTLVWTHDQEPGVALALSLALVGLAAVDILVRRDWRVAATGVVTIPVAIAAATLQLGGTAEEAGAHLVTAIGAVGIGAGLRLRNTSTTVLGTCALTVGVWGELGLSGVDAADAFVAPVALGLLAAGVVARRNNPDDVSSWVAYVMPIALMGGAGLADRIIGGSGAHALVAGGVGLAAVTVGGWRRLAGPLFAGTILLVATVVYESLAVTAGIPTWVWLAIGGAVLLGAGVVMERTATGPIESGRRLVDVITDRFD